MSLFTFECNLAGIVNNEVNSSEVVPQDHTTLTTRVNEEDTFIKQIINGNIYLGKDKYGTMCDFSFMDKSFDTNFFANIVNNNNTFSSYSI